VVARGEFLRGFFSFFLSHFLRFAYCSDAYALSMCWEGKILHHLIAPGPDGSLHLNNKPCKQPMHNIPALITYLRTPHGPPLNWKSPLATFPGDKNPPAAITAAITAARAGGPTAGASPASKSSSGSSSNRNSNSGVPGLASSAPSFALSLPGSSDRSHVFPCIMQLTHSARSLGFAQPTSCGLMVRSCFNYT
jgi:hypothetical protein